MTVTLRQRILLTLVPQLALLAALAGTAAFLLHYLGGSIDRVLREDYASVVYMDRLKESAERMDQAVTMALASKPAELELTRKQFDDQWPSYLENLHAEQNNITVRGEADAVADLTKLTESYRDKGDAFFRGIEASARHAEYDGPGGLKSLFRKINETADRIRRLNQADMAKAGVNSRRTAQNSLIAISCGFALAALLSVWLAWRSTVAILQPIRDLIRSIRGIGAGNLDQVVPVLYQDELGELAGEFNLMARQLRLFRQSSYSRLLRAQRTSQATIDSFPDPVLVLDPEGRVEMANPAAQHLFGVVGRGPDEKPLVTWQSPELMGTPLHDALRAQRPYLPEGFDRAIPITADRVERYFLPRILPIRDPFGETLGAAVLLLDVTRYRLLDQVKSDLVSTASHELKTPLTSLRLAIHLLLEEIVGPLTPKQTELLVDARENAERLLAMVNNLLDLARLERGREHLDIQPARPGDLLNWAADAARPRAQDKGIELAIQPFDDLPEVAADAARIEHALGNLLDNGITHTDRGGRITLSATPESDGVSFAVADTGAGIPPEYLPHVFDRFFRIPGQTRASGTGLGLAIVHEIVTAHGGSVRCESQPGVGTTFRFTLPVWRTVPESESEAQARAANEDGSRGKQR